MVNPNVFAIYDKIKLIEKTLAELKDAVGLTATTADGLGLSIGSNYTKTEPTQAKKVLNRMELANEIAQHLNRPDFLNYLK